MKFELFANMQCKVILFPDVHIVLYCIVLSMPRLLPYLLRMNHAFADDTRAMKRIPESPTLSEEK